MTGGSDPEDSVLIMLDRDIELPAPLDHQSARAPRSPTEQACAAPLILAQAVLGAPWLPSAIYSPRPPSWQGTCGIRGHQGGAGLPDRTKLGLTCSKRSFRPPAGDRALARLLRPSTGVRSAALTLPGGNPQLPPARGTRSVGLRLSRQSPIAVCFRPSSARRTAPRAQTVKMGSHNMVPVVRLSGLLQHQKALLRRLRQQSGVRRQRGLDGSCRCPVLLRAGPGLAKHNRNHRPTSCATQ